MGKRGPKRKPIAERFWPKVDASGDCWEWTGHRDRLGYGKIGLGGKYGGSVWAHRVAWQLLVGEVPEGLELDHLCRNTGCVKPDHLEPVTHQENILRGKRRKGPCKRGHLYEWSILPSGSQRCRGCHREAEARRRDAFVEAIS